MAYSWESRIRYSEVGEDKKLTIPGIIDYFQDCSTFQSEELGVGLDKLLERKRVWVMVSWQIEFFRQPFLGEQVKVETWPYSFKGFYGERNFRMLDKKGETLAQAASMWVYLDLESGHFSRVDEDIISAYVLEEPLSMQPIRRKIPVPQDSVAREPFTVMHNHLDTNHHVNNVQYIVMAQEYLPEGYQPSGLRVEYKKQAVLYDTIVPLVCEENGRVVVSLCDTQEKPYAVVEFTDVRGESQPSR